MPASGSAEAGAASGVGSGAGPASGAGRGAVATRPGRRDRRLPVLVLVPALVGLALLVLPAVALLVRAPWATLAPRLLSEGVLDALRVSLTSALLATALSLVLGVPLAWLLTTSDGWAAPWRRLLRAVVTVPLVLPPVVGGVALLYLLGRQGLIGRPLDAAFGVTVPFTLGAVVIAQTFVAMPFLVLSVEGALRGVDRGLEAAAASLGASRWYAFRRVTVPLVAPGVAAGAVLCFARALGEFGATITFAGTFPGRTQTLPTSVYLAQQSDPESAVAISLLLLAVGVGVLLLLRDRWLTTGAR
ncbi:ABC transporter permease [Frigoribacterium sp. Leaf164]|uniref:ABC transporter permease n=1 Tax=Frigoribacterium sp. Leaf164 TaxID=1736282 RepID=UPI0009E6F657|nr:ABC transporter permease [Frigoribacterium sp. Leaf164]